MNSWPKSLMNQIICVHDHIFKTNKILEQKHVGTQLLPTSCLIEGSLSVWPYEIWLQNYPRELLKLDFDMVEVRHTLIVTAEMESEPERLYLSFHLSLFRWVHLLTWHISLPGLPHLKNIFDGVVTEGKLFTIVFKSTLRFYWNFDTFCKKKKEKNSSRPQNRIF